MKPIAHLALAATLSLAAHAAEAAGKPAPATVTVPISHFHFQSMDVTVPVGGSVVWKNLDGEPHTVVATGGLFRSAALDQGDTFTFRFTQPGVYSYLCTIHPQMRATVTVR